MNKSGRGKKSTKNLKVIVIDASAGGFQTLNNNNNNNDIS